MPLERTTIRMRPRLDQNGIRQRPAVSRNWGGGHWRGGILVILWTRGSSFTSTGAESTWFWLQERTRKTKKSQRNFMVVTVSEENPMYGQRMVDAVVCLALLWGPPKLSWRAKFVRRYHPFFRLNERLVFFCLNVWNLRTAKKSPLKPLPPVLLVERKACFFFSFKCMTFESCEKITIKIVCAEARAISGKVESIIDDAKQIF